MRNLSVISIAVARGIRCHDLYFAEIWLMAVWTAQSAHRAIQLRPENIVFHCKQKCFCVSCVLSSAHDKAYSSLLL